jgi:hypothetical protein
MSVVNTLNEIKKLLRPDKLQSCSQASLTVKEIDRGASLKTLKLVDVGVDGFFIKYDEFGFPGKTLFAEYPNLHRGCDAVVFCEVNGTPHILCLELKSSLPNRPEVAEQFRNAHCFLDYLDSVLNSYCDCNPITNWQRHYFVFHNQKYTPLTKPSLGVTYAQADNLTPDTATFIATQNGASFYMRKLLGIPL